VHDTVHIFKLRSRKSSTSQGSSSSKRSDQPSSPPASIDSREGSKTWIVGMRCSSKRRKAAAFRESSFGFIRCGVDLVDSSSLRKRSMHLTKSLTQSVGGYLRNTLREPSRDFAFLRLPPSGARSIVALSGSVLTHSHFGVIVSTL
jgi:autophagy-related protein 18